MENILLKNSYPVNMAIVGHFKDVKPAVVLGYLMNEYSRYLHVSAVVEGDWFYKTVDDMEKATSYSKSQQATAIKLLESAGMVECKVEKIEDKHPNRMRYFRFTQINILNIENVVKNFAYGGKKIEPPSVDNLTTVSKKINDSQQKNEPPSVDNLTTVGEKFDLNNIYNNPYNELDNHFYNNVLPHIKKEYKSTIEGVIKWVLSRETITVNKQKISVSDFTAHLNELSADTINDVITNVIQQNKPTNPAYMCSCLFNAMNKPEVSARFAGYPPGFLRELDNMECGVSLGASMHNNKPKKEEPVQAEPVPEEPVQAEPVPEEPVQAELYNEWFVTMDDEIELYNKANDFIDAISDYDTAVKALDDLDPRWRHFEGYCKELIDEKLNEKVM